MVARIRSFVDDRLADLARQLHMGDIGHRIFTLQFTAEERQHVRASNPRPPDIIYAWARVKHVHPFEALIYLARTNNLESGLAATLPPGSYTALLFGTNNGTGIGVVEVYDRGL